MFTYVWTSWSGAPAQVTVAHSLRSPSILNSLFFPPPTFSEILCFLTNGDAALMTHLFIPDLPGCFSSSSSSTLMTRTLLVLPFTHRCGIDSSNREEGRRIRLLFRALPQWLRSGDDYNSSQLPHCMNYSFCGHFIKRVWREGRILPLAAEQC